MTATIFLCRLQHSSMAKILCFLRLAVVFQLISGCWKCQDIHNINIIGHRKYRTKLIAPDMHCRRCFFFFSHTTYQTSLGHAQVSLFIRIRLRGVVWFGNRPNQYLRSYCARYDQLARQLYNFSKIAERMSCFCIDSMPTTLQMAVRRTLCV